MRTVLFDLDGTLVDTAPDLAFALNSLLEEEGRSALTLTDIRPVVSQGTPGLLFLGFSLSPLDAPYASLRQRLLDIYASRLARESRLFPGMSELLATIEQRGMNWGIVTNKPAFLTNPLVDQLGMTRRAACIVSGDTTEHSKPHPAPMLYACKQAGSQPYQCLYVGDAQTDIEAGKRAGMKTLIALYGYLSDQDQPHMWGADGMVDHPDAIIGWVEWFDRATVVAKN